MRAAWLCWSSRGAAISLNVSGHGLLPVIARPMWRMHSSEPPSIRHCTLYLICVFASGILCSRTAVQRVEECVCHKNSTFANTGMHLESACLHDDVWS